MSEIAEERLPTPRRAPSVTIVLRIEAAPVVTIDTANDDDFNRIADWIRANDAIHQLVQDAVQIREQSRVA